VDIADFFSEMSDVLVLPTARFVAPELQVEFGAIPPALIPLEGTPAYRFIASRTLAAGGSVVLAANQGAQLLLDHLARADDAAVQCIDVGATTSLAETLLNAITGLSLDGRRLVVNFADTFAGELPDAGDVVMFRTQTDTHRWTTFTVDESGAIASIVDKGMDKISEESQVFVGVFAFADPQLFSACLREALSVEQLPHDPFYEALSYYSHRSTMLFRDTTIWHDFGHLDTYYETRQQFFLNHRDFNSVAVDARRGVIRKTSTDTTKFANEISWYLGLPKDIAALAPRVLAYSLDAHDAFVDMEFYGYPPLAESFLHGAWDGGVWHRVLSTIADTLTMMHAHESLVGESRSAERQALLQRMYLTKTQERVHCINQEHFGPMLGNEVTINGVHCLGLAQVQSLLPAVIARSGLCQSTRFTVIHGDFCLSNILFDRRTSIVRLIDPRGSFGSSFSIYGDPLYDLAKLSHSVHGNYDHLVHELFDSHVDASGVYVETYVTPRQEAVKAQFESWLQHMAGADFAKIRLIESLLFLSMVPLHAGKPRSQQAFLARGLQLFTQSARRMGYWHPRSDLQQELNTAIVQ
jgi:hypothetical protein